MNGWRLAVTLGVFSAGVLASEPTGGPETELSLELLEFLADYGNDEGELELPEDFDEALATPEAVANELPAPASDTGSKAKPTSESRQPNVAAEIKP